MQIAVGPILLLIFVAMIWIARPRQGMDSAGWLQRPWFLGQAYALAALVVAVLGVSFILNSWPA